MERSGRLDLTLPSAPGEGEPSQVFGFADSFPANPFASFSMKAADDSPSPTGRGQGKGSVSNENLLLHRPKLCKE
jgi:hypothetical protein